MDEFHFLRPWWWLALPLLWWLAWQVHRHWHGSDPWREVLSPELYQAQIGAVEAPKRTHLWAIGLGLFLLVGALAGPVWDYQEISAFRSRHARVIVLDLSRSMAARDIKPSRLSRAKHKLRDLLHASRDTAVGLVVFGPVPYVVTPLTDDVTTIEALIPSLTVDLLPVQGSNIGLALNKARELLDSARRKNSEVLLITDSEPKQRDMRAAQALSEAGHQLKVLGVGRASGAQVPMENGALKDARGRLVVARLQEAQLQRLARAGRGLYVPLRADNYDIETLTYRVRINAANDESQAQSLRVWHERGPWLLLPLLLLGALAFRRGGG